MVTRISWSCLRSPDETLNSGFGGAVAHILLQLDLQVLNLHQLARHIVKHPGMAVPLAITWRRLSYQLCLEKLSLHQPNMLVACCDEEGTARVKDHRGNWLRVRLTNSLCIKNMNHGHVVSCCVNLLKAVQMISWTELYLCILLLLPRRMQCFGPDHTDVYIMDCVINI